MLALLAAGGFADDNEGLIISSHDGNVYLFWFVDIYEQTDLKNHSFDIQYRPSTGNDWVTISAGYTNEYVLSDLEPGEYEFRLAGTAPDQTYTVYPEIFSIDVRPVDEEDPYIIPADRQTGDFDVDILSFQSTPFSGGRFNRMEVQVDSAGVSWPYLDINNFEVYEDGILQTNNFVVTPPDTPCFRPADIVFLVDNSGSMGGEINNVKIYARAFADSLEAIGIDWRMGAIRFGQSANSGNPQVHGACQLTGDINVFKDWVDSWYAYGGREPGLQAVIDGMCYNFRPGSSRHFILVTDEDSDGGSLATACQLANINNVKVHSYVSCNSGNSYAHYCGPNGISACSGGEVHSVNDPFWDVLGLIEDQVCGSYLVRYIPTNDTCDGLQREVVVFAQSGPHSDYDTTYYTPCMAPVVTVTPITRDLELVAQLNNVPLTIEAWVVDKVSPYIQPPVVLYYRTTGGTTYNSMAMINFYDTLYSAVIPGVNVNTPGVDYYIRATDGQSVGTAPKSDPDAYPYQIAVMPNEPPIIDHDTLGPYQPVSIPLDVIADIMDTTFNVVMAEMHCRQFGDLIYTMYPMVDMGGNIFIAVIPASINAPGGCEYYIVAEDDYGLKSYHGDADFPHQINVQPIECAGRNLILPYPMYTPYANYVGPIIYYDPFIAKDTISIPLQHAKLYVAEFDPGYTAADLDMASLRINDSIVPTVTALSTEVPIFPAELVLVLDYSIRDFILSYGQIYDWQTVQYYVTGNYIDGVEFATCGELPIRGHISGDLNSDGFADITDITILISYFFGGQSLPCPERVADFNHDGIVDISDLVSMAEYMFTS